MALSLRGVSFDSSATLYNPSISSPSQAEAQTCVVASRSIGITPVVVDVGKSSAFKMGEAWGRRTADSKRKSESDEVRVSRVWVELRVMMTVR